MTPVPEGDDAGFDLDSEEHRARLAVRRGHAEGKHIRRQNERPQSMSDVDYTALLALIDRLKAEANGVHEPVFDRKGMFDLTVTFGNVLTIIAAIGAGLASYYGIKAQIADLTNMEITDRRDIDAIRADILTNRAKYVPLIDAQQRINDTQNDRLQNLAEGLKQERDNLAEQSKIVTRIVDAMASMHEDFAVLKERLMHDMASEPKKP